MDRKRPHKTLNHDPERFVVAVEVTDHAEQHAGDDGFGRKAAQVRKSPAHDLGVSREQTREHITLQHDEHDQQHEQHRCEYREHDGRAICQALTVSTLRCIRRRNTQPTAHDTASVITNAHQMSETSAEPLRTITEKP